MNAGKRAETPFLTVLLRCGIGALLGLGLAMVLALGGAAVFSKLPKAESGYAVFNIILTLASAFIGGAYAFRRVKKNAFLCGILSGGIFAFLCYFGALAFSAEQRPFTSILVYIALQMGAGVLGAIMFRKEKRKRMKKLKMKK